MRIAVDSQKDAEALAQIRAPNRRPICRSTCRRITGWPSSVAPHVDKIRYNPGHLYHHEREKPWQDKVRFLVDVAGENDCAMRVGVNCGSVDPAKLEKYADDDSLAPMLDSAWEHCELLGLAGLHALLRLAEGFRSGQGDRGQSPLRRASGPTCRCTWA